VEILTCRTCGKEFDLDAKRKIIKAGYRDQCASCSTASGDHRQKYLGRPGATNKGSNISIFRTSLDFVRHVLRLENRRGRTANLDFKSVVKASEKEDELK